MNCKYKTEGVCSRQISFDINQGIVTNVSFVGGCNGNLKAIGKLVEGMAADDIVKTLRGNTCGMKRTSCADQLAIAVDMAKEQEAAGS